MEKGGAQRPDMVTALHLASTTVKKEPFLPATLPLSPPHPLHTPQLGYNSIGSASWIRRLGHSCQHGQDWTLTTYPAAPPSQLGPYKKRHL